mgnify:CR=1 FL=1
MELGSGLKGTYLAEKLWVEACRRASSRMFSLVGRRCLMACGEALVPAEGSGEDVGKAVALTVVKWVVVGCLEVVGWWG